MVPAVFLILKVTLAGMVPEDPKGPQIGTVLVVVFTFTSQAEKLYTEPGQRLFTCVVKKRSTGPDAGLPALIKYILPLVLPVWSPPTAQSAFPEF